MQLGPGTSEGIGGKGQGSGKGKGNGNSEGKDLDTMSVARGLTFEHEVAITPWLNAVWRHIDTGVEYPEDFARQRIVGSIQVQVDLDGEGKLKGGFHRIRSDQKYLRAYVLATLTKCLKEGISKTAWRPEGMSLALHFRFEASPDPGAANRDRGGVIRNQLSFSRKAYANPEWEEKFERFFTKYVPPILPMPGGFFVDFVRLYKMVDQWGKEDETDLRSARVEQLYQLFQSRIK